MVGQDLNKSPAWHMAQIRASINEAKRLNNPATKQKEQRREYWERLHSSVGGLGSYKG